MSSIEKGTTVYYLLAPRNLIIKSVPDVFIPNAMDMNGLFRNSMSALLIFFLFM